MERQKKSLKSRKEAISKLYKKVLDKTAKQVYNIHKDSERGNTPITTLITETTIDLDRSTITKGLLERLSSTVANTINGSPHLRDIGLHPVFAGGCIRDLVLGTRVNDYDLFLDLGKPSEDGKDNLDLFLYEMRNTGHEVEKQENENYSGLMETVGGFDNFEVYTFYPPDYSYTLQVIAGFYDLENPLDIYQKFDYNLVKGSLDPFTGNFQLSEDLLYGVTEGKLVECVERGTGRGKRYLRRDPRLLEKFGQPKPKISARKGDAAYFEAAVQAAARPDPLQNQINPGQWVRIEGLFNGERRVRVLDEEVPN